MAIQKEGILVGLAPDKCLKILILNERGSYHESTLPLALALVPQLDVCFSKVGSKIKVTVENGEIEALEWS